MSFRVTRRSLSATVVSGAILASVALSGCHRAQSTPELIASAKQYQQKGDNKAALIEFKNAVAASPQDAEARLLLAQLYNDMGDPVSAEKESRKALSLGAKPEQALPALGTALLAQGQFQKVLDETAALPDAPPLAVLRGQAYLALRDGEKSTQAFETTLKAQPDNPAALIGLARGAMARNDVEAATRYATQALAKNPNSMDALAFNGALLRSRNQLDEAVAMYDRMLALKPAYLTANLEKAHIEIQRGKFDAAAADIAAARKTAPNSLQVAYSQAFLDYSRNNNAAALESLQKVLRAAPEHMPSILLSGAVEFRLGSLQQAEQHLKKFLESNPKDALYARKLLAGVYLSSGRPADAVATLEPVLKEASQDPQVLALAGEAALQTGDFKKADGYFGQASALAPKAAGLHTSLGLSKLGQGNGAEAERELELATTLDASSKPAGLALVSAELRLQHFDKALAAALALEKAQPKDPMVPNLLGGIYMAKNDPAQARASFDKALALKPDYFPAVLNLARLDMKEKHPESARKRFEAVLQKDKTHAGAMEALAELALAEGKSGEATAWLEKANSAHPESLPGAMRLASRYLHTGEKQKALALTRKYQTENSANPELLDLLGQAQLANGDKEGALDTYSKLAAVMPKSAGAQVRVAGAHMLLNNNEAAAEDLKKALALQPDFLQAQLAQVELAIRSGHVDEALAIARQVQHQRPSAAIGYALEGDLQLRNKKPELALPLYERGFALEKSATLMSKLYAVLTALGKEKQAEQRVQQWQAAAAPGDMQVAAFLVGTSMEKKQYPVAIQNIQKILQQDPNNAALLNNLAWAYQQVHDPRALPTAERAYQLASDSPQVMDTLGWLLVEQGNAARGVPLLQRAVGLAPSATLIRLHLATGLQKAGDKAAARKELQQVLAAGNKSPEYEQAQTLLKQM